MGRRSLIARWAASMSERIPMGLELDDVLSDYSEALPTLPGLREQVLDSPPVFSSYEERLKARQQNQHLVQVYWERERKSFREGCRRWQVSFWFGMLLLRYARQCRTCGSWFIRHHWHRTQAGTQALRRVRG